MVVAGGVAANQALRAEMVRRLSSLVPNEIIFTAPELCTDNAAMVAAGGGLVRQGAPGPRARRVRRGFERFIKPT